MEITAEFIKDAWIKHKQRLPKVKDNAAYVEGKNPTIETEPDKPKPDNRIPVPMAKMAVNTIVGYAGRPGDITTEYELVDAKDEGEGLDAYQETLRAYQAHNDEDIENSELLDKALEQGWAYELWWTSDVDNEIMPEYKIVPSAEAYPVYSDSLKPEMEAFIRFWCDKDDYEIADVYEPYLHTQYRRKKGDETFILTEEEETPYSEPAIEFRVNMDMRPVFDAEKPLIDSYDSAISKSQNEVDRFNALILMMPGKMKAELKQAMAEGESAFLDKLGEFERWPEYLQKNMQGINEFYKNHSENLERLFHKSVGIPDISDENFAGNQSGVAIAFKLLPLEFLVVVVEAYFKRGLEKRKQFYDDFIDMFEPSLSSDSEDYKATVTWKRNLPVDEEAKVKVAAMLSGLVSKETMLRSLPNTIVPDVKDELGKEGSEPLDMEDDNIPETGA